MRWALLKKNFEHFVMHIHWIWGIYQKHLLRDERFEVDLLVSVAEEPAWAMALLSPRNSSMASSSSSSSFGSSSSSPLSTLRVSDETCDGINSPSNPRFLKFPIQNADEHLLAASAPFILKTSCSSVSRKNGIWAMIPEFLIFLESQHKVCRYRVTACKSFRNAVTFSGLWRRLTSMIGMPCWRNSFI